MGQLRQTLHEVNGLTAERRKQLMDERQQAGEYLGPSGSPFAFTNAQVRMRSHCRAALRDAADLPCTMQRAT
jgi:hypothetical protein